MAKQTLRIGIAQINTTVGDLEGNSQKLLQYLERAKALKTDIVTFPELALSGYPPEDLLLKPRFIKDNLDTLTELAKRISGIIAIVGFADRNKKAIYNSAAVIYDGKVRGIYHKTFLPNYGVFDEKRYFTAGAWPTVFRIGRVIFGVNICEDIWHKAGPTSEQARLGAKLILNISASPYHAGKVKEREKVIRDEATRNRVCIVYNNMVGGQDELVFDGQSMFVDIRGRVLARAHAFEEELLVADLDLPESRHMPGRRPITVAAKYMPDTARAPLPKKVSKLLDPVAEVYQALIVGLRDYTRKNGFNKVVIGMSGGIDSSLVAALAADALGKENVTGVYMPSRYSSGISGEDAETLCRNMGIKFMTIPIEQMFETYLSILRPHFADTRPDITEENLQSRIRGSLLMALSNKFGWLVLATGNKSEMSTGYATLYGDMVGGFALIKDVPKMLVYKLAQHRNSVGSVIPERVLTRPPTAELRENQKDTDTLPPYETLDPILKAYVEEDKELPDIARKDLDRELIGRVLGMVDRSEYKRRQSPPGIKITPKAFGRDRRMPITNKYRG